MDIQRMKQDERISIVMKYDKSFKYSEDESEESYAFSATDLYGFFIKSDFVSISKQQQDKWRISEIKRREKWLKMVRCWDKYVGSEKLAKRVYKGIPQGMRGDVWRLLLEVHKYLEHQPNVYENMKSHAFEFSEEIRQIDLDVNRTFRNHVMFAQRYSIKQRQLFCVLAAYSMYNTEVGYCQGMSQIAALLLMYMDEEEAFWALHSLLYGERHRMHGFFIPGFPKLLRFQHHHDQILTKLLPKLKKHLDKNEVFASLYTMKWFFQCFLDRTPFSLSLRLWDIYALEGEKLLTAMPYATLKLHKSFLKTQDMDGIISFLQEELKKDFGKSDDAVVNYLKDCMIELKNSTVDKPPPPSQAELPKGPFSAAIPATEKENKASVKVPHFAKHSICIATPVQKRNPSNEEDSSVTVTQDEKSWPLSAKKTSKPKVTSVQEARPYNYGEHPIHSPIPGSMRKHLNTGKTGDAKDISSYTEGSKKESDGKNALGCEKAAFSSSQRQIVSSQSGEPWGSGTTLKNPVSSVLNRDKEKDPLQSNDWQSVHTLPAKCDSNSRILATGVSDTPATNGYNFLSISDISPTLNRDLKTKAPSFSELSAVIDSVHDEVSSTVGMGIASRFLVHSHDGGRPQSIYDNVPSSGTSPVAP